MTLKVLAHAPNNKSMGNFIREYVPNKDYDTINRSGALPNTRLLQCSPHNSFLRGKNISLK